MRLTLSSRILPCNRRQMKMEDARTDDIAKSLPKSGVHGVEHIRIWESVNLLYKANGKPKIDTNDQLVSSVILCVIIGINFPQLKPSVYTIEMYDNPSGTGKAAGGMYLSI